MECSAVFSSRAAGESAADRCSDISGMVVGNGVVGRAEEEGKQEEAEGDDHDEDDDDDTLAVCTVELAFVSVLYYAAGGAGGADGADFADVVFSLEACLPFLLRISIFLR